MLCSCVFDTMPVRSAADRCNMKQQEKAFVRVTSCYNIKQGSSYPGAQKPPAKIFISKSFLKDTWF